MMFGLGLVDDGYAMSLHNKAYFLVHEQKRWRDEQFSVDSLGYSLKLPLTKMVAFTSHVKLGYEHHYRSEHYARSYVASSAGFGVETTHNLVRFAFSVEPGKYFYKLSDEQGFSRHSFRVAPSATVSVLFNISDTLFVPKTFLQEKHDEKIRKSVPRNPRPVRRVVRPAGTNSAKGGDGSRQAP